MLMYLFRLACLCFATFFVVHLALGALVRIASPWAVRFASRCPARHASQQMFVLRLVPLGGALALVLGLCTPSYLWLEPVGTSEQAGSLCLLAAALGGSICAISATRAIRALLLSWIVRRRLAPVQDSGIWLIDGPTACFALAGILKPRVILSRSIADALSPDQLDAALQHERAHRSSSDNLKKLAFLLAPGLLPFTAGFSEIEAAWARFSEWAADDEASDSLSLASALVRIARLNPAMDLPLTSSLLTADEDLSIRVERLLVPRRPVTRPGNLASLLALSPLALLLIQPAILNVVHRTLEFWFD